jgi:hypothetical protein
MGEYEDRYPDAYGHGEVIEEDAADRHFSGSELPRQTRDRPPSAHTARLEARQPYRERVVRQFVERPAQDIRDDVVGELNDSPFIDATGIAVTVEGSEVMLGGTINSLMAISLAQALVSNVAGVSRVQVRLRVQQARRG